MSYRKCSLSSEDGKDDVIMSPEKRDKLFEFHPVCEQQYRLQTPVQERVYALVRERVWARRTGIYFHGAPRLGKSTCAEEVQALLNEEFERIYVLLVSVRGSLRHSECHMFQQILEASKHKLHTRKTPHVLFVNAKTDIVMQVRRRQGSQFVLILDEMHLLNDYDLQKLLTLHNALAIENVKMTTVSFAQPEILHKVTGLLTKGQRQIIARFLSEPVSFEGCSSAAELKTLLKGYDEHSEFPENSGWSYTKFFLPEAFENGFRISNFSGEIWEELIKVSVDVGPGLPMEHVCNTIEYLLKANVNADCANFSLTSKEIEEAVNESNLKNFHALMHED